MGKLKTYLTQNLDMPCRKMGRVSVFLLLLKVLAIVQVWDQHRSDYEHKRVII